MMDIPDRHGALEELIKTSANHKMTSREVWLQRLSFAYGNTSLENPLITLDMVERLSIEMYGPCPE